MRVCCAAQGCVSSVVKNTIGDVQVPYKLHVVSQQTSTYLEDYTHSPDINVVPVYNRMYAHEGRPAMVSGIEMCQMLAMRICSPCPYEDALDLGSIMEVVCKCSLHGLVVLQQ
jgi:hypothetical protein